MPGIVVGLITEFDQAEAIIARGDADFVALARAMLYDPRCRGTRTSRRPG